MKGNRKKRSKKFNYDLFVETNSSDTTVITPTDNLPKKEESIKDIFDIDPIGARETIPEKRGAVLWGQSNKRKK